jgi:hypothetical protein
MENCTNPVAFGGLQCSIFLMLLQLGMFGSTRTQLRSLIFIMLSCLK